MDEKEYIELQNLLTKLRVKNLKMIGLPKTDQSGRNKYYKIIRCIDFIRNNALVEIEGEIYK